MHGFLAKLISGAGIRINGMDHNYLVLF